MTKLSILFISIFFLISTVSTFAQDLPERPSPPTLVNDFAEILNSSQRASLENKLSNYHDSTSSQIAIVIVPSLNGYEVAQYAVELAEKWGIGQKGQDNGILILVATNDRRMNISTGYGVEAFVPDVTANRIIDRTLSPNFKNQNYYEGLDQATSILMSLLSGQFIAEPKTESFPIISFLVILGIFLVILFIRSRGGGGGRGGGSRPTVHTFGSPYRGGSGWSDFNSGGGSFGGGGGFGGFGGGSFGGGGASGSW